MGTQLDHVVGPVMKTNEKYRNISMGMNLIYNTIEHEKNVKSTGQTGYIDFIEPSDFPSGVNQLKGVDLAGRKFVSFLVLANWEKGAEWEGVKGEDRVEVVTLFQRYMNDPDFWVEAGDWGYVLCRDDEHILDLKKISDLFHGKKVVRKERIGPDLSIVPKR